MAPGQKVAVHWRDTLPGSEECNKQRSAIVIRLARVLLKRPTLEIVVPLTGEAALAIAGAATRIAPTPENGCTKVCYALAWNVQSVPHARLIETPSCVTAGQLASIRAQITACIEA